MRGHGDGGPLTRWLRGRFRYSFTRLPDSCVEYGPADEPWGVRRFYVRDPFGKLVNVLAHR